jgi:hypothetical protein
VATVEEKNPQRHLESCQPRVQKNQQKYCALHVPSTKEINLESENSKSAFPTNFIVEMIFTVSESKITVLESRFTVLRVE